MQRDSESKDGQVLLVQLQLDVSFQHLGDLLRERKTKTDGVVCHLVEVSFVPQLSKWYEQGLFYVILDSLAGVDYLCFENVVVLSFTLGFNRLAVQCDHNGAQEDIVLDSVLNDVEQDVLIFLPVKEELSTKVCLT